ncbi:MAG TPA: YceI family protein [Rhizomicrobium sp.]|jgi:polyisoprenoid-binding protein YceI|nr:YceI family protein [Rhizomicrobium sp.]
MKTLALAAVLLLAAVPAHAASWMVDHAKSRLGFSVQWSGEALNATFKSWDAKIDFDPANLAAAHVTATIRLDSEDSGSSDNDDGIKGATGFAARQFPAATFETTGFKSKGGNAYEATGRLNLHGMTKIITLPFTLTFAGNTAHMVGKAVVSRIDFGIGTSGEWAGETPVAHTVSITVDLTATKAG